MRIAEMEAHHDAHEAMARDIVDMLAKRDFQAMFSACLASLPHIVPANKFRKKREIVPLMPELPSLIMICRYGPPLFEHDAMTSLLDFVRSTRLLAKHQNNYLQSVEAALASEEAARILWNCISQNPGFLQCDIQGHLGLDEELGVNILGIWEELGLILRRRQNDSSALYLAGRMDTKVTGICHSCGVSGIARKELFLEPISCKRCGADGYYLVVDTTCK